MALDDFMLKILLVSACISLSLEMIFAEPEDRSHGKYPYRPLPTPSPLFLSIIIIFDPYLFNIAWIEGFAIFMAVFVVSMVTAVNDYAKEGQFLDLQ
jgi:hypothetical protein